MHIEIEKTHPDAYLPRRSSNESCTYDLFSAYDLYVPGHEQRILSIGLHLHLNDGEALQVFQHMDTVRSGLVMIPGVSIISGSGGREIILMFANFSGKGHLIRKSDKVATISKLVTERLDFISKPC